MNSDFPNPDEEFDLIHEDDFEVLRELENSQIQKKTQAPSQTIKEKSQVTSEQPKKIDSDFPDPDEEFDFFHQDDFQVQREIENSQNQKKSQPEISQSLKQNDQLVPCGQEKGASSQIQNSATNSTQPRNKRTVEELLRDADDLLGPLNFDDFREVPVKRPRWDNPKELIQMIAERRNKINVENDASYGLSRPSQYTKDGRETITKRVPMWDFVAVTRNSDGERFYVKVANNNYVDTKRQVNTDLLSTPFSKLKAEAEKILIKNTQQQQEPIQKKKKTIDFELWVKKYKPSRYLDLLSDESVNRNFLHWMKLWDKIVFDRDPSRRPKPQPVYNNKFKAKFVNDEQEVDSKGFPVRRVVLLSGPPGLGKTTLAHVAAKHAGYNPVEINASDERGPDAFREILKSSTQMTAVLDGQKRPNCLILDEIDGAPAASINLLLQFISGRLAMKGKKKDNATSGCRRPIICICNDVYTPSLRPLRNTALLITVPEVTPAALADRLVEIADKEGLDVEARLLLQLAERSGCDVRACIGILQYTGGGSDIMENLTLGLKDTKVGLFDSWKAILQIPMTRKGPMSTSERVKHVLHTAHQGETERLVQGIFHNYPGTCKERMAPLLNSLEWFELYDQISTVVNTLQTWTLMPYANYAFVAWHLNLANTVVPKLSYPSAAYEAHQKLEKNVSILLTLKKACKLDQLTLTLDVTPYLPDLLAPQLRSVSAHLYSAREKVEFHRLVNVILDLGLSLIQEKQLGGEYDYILVPNVMAIGAFDVRKQRRSLPYAVKQILVQEIEMERVRRMTIHDIPNKEKPTKKVNESPIVKSSENPPNNPSSTPNHLRQLNAVPVESKPESKNRNFFRSFQALGEEKRKKSLQNQPPQEEADKETSPKTLSKAASIIRSKKLLKSDVWYKFKEGYINAVRRNITMEELL